VTVADGLHFGRKRALSGRSVLAASANGKLIAINGLHGSDNRRFGAWSRGLGSRFPPRSCGLPEALHSCPTSAAGGILGPLVGASGAIGGVMGPT